MIYAAESDPLCYPGTTVLRNLLDLTNQQDLDEAELALTLTRFDEPLPAGNLDVSHYYAVHHHLFQDVYSWAGQPRTIRIGKGGNWFCYPEHIESQLGKAFAELGDPDTLQGAEPAVFAKRVAHFLAELNAVHPFREGNGRTQLAFLSMLAEHAGFPFNADTLERARVLTAMIESFDGTEEPLAALIHDLIN
ncbi:MAG TPA: Fic family protein [Verrucomicrobiae bacterium]|nr:Fic family protein [Verrucomicrobiae bacterium]